MRLPVRPQRVAVVQSLINYKVANTYSLLCTRGSSRCSSRSHCGSLNLGLLESGMREDPGVAPRHGGEPLSISRDEGKFLLWILVKVSHPIVCVPRCREFCFEDRSATVRCENTRSEHREWTPLVQLRSPVRLAVQGSTRVALEEVRVGRTSQARLGEVLAEWISGGRGSDRRRRRRRDRHGRKQPALLLLWRRHPRAAR